MKPQRRTNPVNHLDAHLTTVEHALEYRAGRLEDEIVDEVNNGEQPSVLKMAIAAELRALAEELHYW